MDAIIDTTVSIPTRYGAADLITFRDLIDDREHIALAFGNWREQKVPQVRIHSECLTGDVFGSQRCDCGPQLDEAMRRFSQSDGIVLYLRQEGRGIGLLNKMRAYALQDQGFDTYEANRLLGFADDEREFAVAAQMLRALDIREVCLLSNNPRKSSHLQQSGILVRQRLFTKTYICATNRRYLTAKSQEGGHDGLTNLYAAVVK